MKLNVLKSDHLILELVYPSFQFIFYVDHSCCHDRQRHDGLNANKMNKGWGGKQCIVHQSKIDKVEAYLGKYNSILKPGDTQDMVFSSSDICPFYMSFAEREAEREPRNTGNIFTRDRTKKNFYN